MGVGGRDVGTRCGRMVGPSRRCRFVHSGIVRSLVELQGRVGQTSRRQMLAGMIRKALKVVPMDETTTEKPGKGLVYVKGQDGGTLQYLPLDGIPATGLAADHDAAQCAHQCSHHDHELSGK